MVRLGQAYACKPVADAGYLDLLTPMVQPRKDPADAPSESMNYGILGKDAATPEDKLEKYTGEVSWSYLKPHFEAGALLFVDPSLDLVEVGKAVGNDEVERVKQWRSSGDLLTPSQPHADFWEESKVTFKAVVVSPFVLVQPAEETGN